MENVTSEVLAENDFISLERGLNMFGILWRYTGLFKLNVTTVSPDSMPQMRLNPLVYV